MDAPRFINIAVIAHVDAGKSTLVDALLAQGGVFRENEAIVDCVMDSNDLERERGITIYSKNCSIMHNGIKINIVDTPGHADFSSEVERILKTVDTVILLVDAKEGPMPQTRFVLQKSLQLGLNPILLINKIDKKDQRAEEVVDLTLDLFIELNANDQQLEFPVLYSITREGVAKLELDSESNDLSPLFDTIINHVPIYPDYNDEPLQMQVSALSYDDYVGRIGIGRVFKGTIKQGQTVSVCKADGSVGKGRIVKLLTFEGIKQKETEIAYSGDIIAFAGISDISIGETVCDIDNPIPMEMIRIDEPTLSMNFIVNDSPFAGTEGKFVTTRHIKSRLERELETNVGLRVEPMDTTEGYKVSGRGELHLSILLENMRREGYEVQVSRPQVIFKEIGGETYEPYEKAIIDVPDEYSGGCISELNQRKGVLSNMFSENGYTRLEYMIPTRGLLGFRSQFITMTRGEGTLVHSFEEYQPYAGNIPSRTSGVIISQENDVTMAYSLWNLEERGILFIDPGTKVYEGMIIGLHNRDMDIVVNPCKNKKLTNMRASGSDEAIRLTPPKKFTLEQALEFIEEDELVEITPKNIRLRKKILSENDRVKALRKLTLEQEQQQ